MMAHKYWNFFILISTLSIQVQWTTAQGQDNLGEMLGGFLEGMKEALGQIQKPGATGDGKAAPPNPMEGIKNLVESINPEQINQFLKNMGSPDSLVEFIPAKFRELLPEEWRTKVGEILASELDKLAEVWDGVSKHKSGEDLWKALKAKTPKLAELLEEAWQTSVNKWNQFEGGLEPDAKGYVDNLKSSFGQWLSQKVLGPFSGLPTEAKVNLRESFERAFPLFEPIVTKAVQSEGLGQWAEELASGQKADEQAVKEKEQKEAKVKVEEEEKQQEEEEKDEL